MSNRGEELARQLEQANAELLAAIEGCADEHWGKQAESDGRSVCVVAHHTAGSLVIVADWVRAVAAGQPIAVGLDAIEDANRTHAEKYGAVSPEDVAGLARRNGERAAAILRGLADDELERRAPIAFLGGQELSAAELAERVLIGHVRGHTRDISGGKTQ